MPCVSMLSVHQSFDFTLAITQKDNSNLSVPVSYYLGLYFINHEIYKPILQGDSAIVKILSCEDTAKGN